MSARVTRKRARVESGDESHDAQNSAPQDLPSGEPQENPEHERTQDEEFWYDDGNIIVVARDVQFRIYKGLLADHSPVFRDMFSFPQPPVAPTSNTGPAGDTCPVVHVSDSPDDFKHILRFYMPRDDCSPFDAGEPSFGMISAAIRLGQKYQMSKLLAHAVDYLRTYYTDDFDLWTLNTKHNWPPGWEAVHSIGVVNLARQTGERSLLAPALLLCCMLDAAVVRGFQREDGSREQLTLADIGLCFAAKDRLAEESVRIALHVFEPVTAEKCKTRPECAQAFTKMLRELRDKAYYIASTNIFAPYEMFRGIRLCRVCAEMVRKRDLRQRRAAWDRLSELLGIDKADLHGEGTGEGESAHD